MINYPKCKLMPLWLYRNSLPRLISNFSLALMTLLACALPLLHASISPLLAPYSYKFKHHLRLLQHRFRHGLPITIQLPIHHTMHIALPHHPIQPHPLTPIFSLLRMQHDGYIAPIQQTHQIPRLRVLGHQTQCRRIRVLECYPRQPSVPNNLLHTREKFADRRGRVS